MLVLFCCISSDVEASSEQALRKKALIFGVTGQDGQYLTAFLISQNYEVHGVARHPVNTKNTSYSSDLFIPHVGDIADYFQVLQLIGLIRPDEIYNLAAQSSVKVSFNNPKDTANTNALGVLHILEAVKLLDPEKKMKVFQASSAELYGLSQENLITEKSRLQPCSPYGVAKLYAHAMIINYRESYQIFACNGILFNHESPLRGETFVTRKITLTACRIALGLQDILYLGNLDTVRDWGYAKDYVEAMWLMLQQEQPDDYLIATGKLHSVREFVEQAFQELGIAIAWYGKGVEEYGINKKTGAVIVKVNPQFFRPSESNFLLASTEKAKKGLNWEPKTHFKELVCLMVTADYQKTLGEKTTQ